MNPIKMIKRQMYGRANFDLLRKRILVDTDFSLSVWLFNDTDLNVTRYDEDGTTAKVRQEFLAILNAASYPTEWIPVIAFSIDSRENVERNYFYRFDGTTVPATTPRQQCRAGSCRSGSLVTDAVSVINLE